MNSSHSVTAWIEDLKAGDEQAAQNLWERYCTRLGELALRHLRNSSRRAADEEDVAQLAFLGLCTGAKEGRFPKLFDRDDLWQLLMMLTERKAIDHIKHEARQKRGGGGVRGESAFVPPGEDSGRRGIEQVVDHEPTPEYAAMAAEQCRRLLSRLEDERLVDVAGWKMQGHSNAEIAAKLGCVERTVERKLRGIRKLWEEEPT